MAYKPTLDYSELTSGEESVAWEANSYRKSDEYDIYATKTHFIVRVLTRPVTLSGEEYTAIMGDAAEATNAQPAVLAKDLSRIMFKGRIISHGGVPSPHLTLPDPTALSDTVTPEGAQCAARIIAMHTTFFSNGSHTGPLPSPGSIVRVRLNPGDIGKFNLQYASFTSFTEQASTARDIIKRGKLKSLFTKPQPKTPVVSSPNDKNVVINNATSGSPTVIYFWPGVPDNRYGAAYVKKAVEGLILSPNLIIVIAETSKTPYNSLEKSAETALAGKTQGIMKAGGWSGGAVGLSKAIGLDSFSTIVYADPSPSPLIGKTHKNAKMYYNPSNWGDPGSSNYRLGQKQKTLAAEMGSNAHLVNDNHRAILINALKELIGPS
tara:strand:- start:594 stop:1727 length:1134 start_codon:yes stop_codon:yes gene_type:complete